MRRFADRQGLRKPRDRAADLTADAAITAVVQRRRFFLNRAATSVFPESRSDGRV